MCMARAQKIVSQRCIEVVQVLSRSAVGKSKRTKPQLVNLKRVAVFKYQQIAVN